MLETPPLPSMLVPSLTVSNGDDANGYSVPPQHSNPQRGGAVPSPGQLQIGLQGSSYMATSSNAESRRPMVWRPKITIGSRVVINEPQVGDSEDCTQVHVGGYGAPMAASISSHRVVCEVMRCPNPRQVVVRSVHAVVLRRGGRGGIGPTNVGADDTSPRTSRAHSSTSSLGGGTGHGPRTISEFDSANDAALHHVHTMAPAPSPPPSTSSARVPPPSVGKIVESESFSPTDLSSPLGGSAIKMNSRSASTPPLLLPIDTNEEEDDSSSSSRHQRTHSTVTGGQTTPPLPPIMNPPMFRSSSSTIIDAMTLQHTVPSHRVSTVLEYLLRQIGVLPLVQRLMGGRDYASVVVILEQAGERIATTHLGELVADPTEAAAAARLFQSFLLICGEDPSVLRDTSTTYASRLRPELAILHAFRGQLLCSLRRFDEALSAASTALTLDPLCPESFHVAVKALFAQDRLDDAMIVVNVASSSLAALSPELRSLVTAVRASMFLRSALRSQRGLSIIPISPDEILRSIRLQSQVINKICLTVTDRTALSLHTIEDTWQQHGPPHQHNHGAVVANGAPGLPAAFRLFPHKTLRCIAMRDFASSFVTSAEHEGYSTRGNPLSGSGSNPSGRSIADSMVAEANGERVLIDVSPILLPLTAVLPAEVRQKIKSTRLGCGYCGWLLAPKCDVLSAARLVHPGLEKRVRDHYPCRVPVPCEGSGCSEMYCSEVCRIKAFVAYHELECEARENSTWRPVQTLASSNDFFASTDGALRWANNKMAAMEAAAKQGVDASPLLGSSSPRRRVSDVVFTTSPTEEVASSTSPVSGGGGGGGSQNNNNNNAANLSHNSSNSNNSGPRPQRESSEEFGATQSVAFAPNMEDSLPRRWSLAYEQQAAAGGGITIQPHPPSSTASTVKEASLPFGANSPTPTFSPQLSHNGGQRGSVTSELSSQAPSPHRPRQSKGQAMFSARFQAARRSSTTVRGSADVVASLRTSIKRAYHEITEGELREAPTIVRTASAVFVRCLTTLLSLFFPATLAWDGAQRVQRQQRGGLHTKEHQLRKSNVLRAAIEACEARGVTHAGDRSAADKRDPHSLAIAEELFRRLGIPFTSVERSSHGTMSTTLPAVPSAVVPQAQIKRDSLLAPIAPSFPNSSARRGSKAQQHAAGGGAAKVKDSSSSDALHHLWVFVHSASSVIRLRCSDAAVAVTAACTASASISGPQPSGPPSPRGNGSGPNSIFYASPTPMSPFQNHRRVSAVWTLEDDADSVSAANPMISTQTTGTMSVLQHLTLKEEPNIWTIGRLLSFLEHPVFTEMLWDMCLTSHCIVPLCGPAAAVGPHVPRHLLDSWIAVSRNFQVGVVVLSRTLSLVTDWQRGASSHDCGLDAAATASTSMSNSNSQINKLQQQRIGTGNSVALAVAAPTPPPHHHHHHHFHVQSRFAAAPQSRSLSMVGSMADLRSSRGLLSLSSQGSRSSSSDDSDSDDDTEGAAARGGEPRSTDPTPVEGEQQQDGHLFHDDIVLGNMMQASQWSMDLRSQRDNGGNVAVDPADPAMCCPGERRIVLRSICPLRARDTLRLVMQADAVDAFLAEFLEDPGSFRCSTTQLAFPM